MINVILQTLLVSIILNVGYAQPYTNLVFEGGGMRGICFAGAIHEMEKQGLLTNIEKVGGTSVGAITALTLSLGYSASEIQQIIGSTNPQKFNDGNFLFFGAGRRLRNHYGLYKGNAFVRWTEKVIAAKTGNKDITFKELHDRKFLDLYVTGTSINNQKVIVFSHETYPDMKVKDAVRISMSVPFFFQAVFIDPHGRVLTRKEAVGDFDIMVDGGLVANFPIQLFDSLDPTTNTRTSNPHTLGFRLDAKNQLEYDKVNKGLAPVQVQSLRNYVGGFYNYIHENMNRANLNHDDWARTVSIVAERVGPKIKKFSDQETELLIDNGRLGVQEFLRRRDSSHH
jgi:NTE family protein